MGEMTIRLTDDELSTALAASAEQAGLSIDAFVEKTLRTALAPSSRRALLVSRAILSRGGQPSPISAVDLLDEIRAEER